MSLFGPPGRRVWGKRSEASGGRSTLTEREPAAVDGHEDEPVPTQAPQLPAVDQADEEEISTFGRAIQSPVILVSGGILIFFLLIAIIGPTIAPYPPREFHTARAFEGPSADFWFGTDQFGRDVFSRVLVGTRSIFMVSFSATFLGVLVGTVIGLAAGYYGGWIDEVVMRVADGVMSFPSLLLALLILTMLGPATINVILGIAIVFVPRVARIIRSVALDIRTQQFIQAAEARGERSGYIILREMLPNAWPPIIVEASIRVSYAILISASLGFLGLGVQPPTPDWGLMIFEGRGVIAIAPWMVLAPAIAISTLVIATNLLADGLSRVLIGRSAAEGAN
jgi:peptide/nickel transport system permease protein